MRRPVPVKPKMILGRKTTTAHRRPTGGVTPGRITTNGDPRPTGGPPSASFFPLRSGLVLLFWSCRHTGDRDHREPRSSQSFAPCCPGFPSADAPRFHSHSSMGGLRSRCQLGFSILKRVLPSQCRTEASPFPATLVPPRPRSHPNSALAYQSH